ncbi:hypothetical protein DPEC_G00344800 [Dallia pectoralis]|uniref:Uncharacterized protein n=1 Tax=Dallia pectoralis TaxID=75939 RepID=A0ACC2F3A3_DALPE|nr:hypothetical protein DPEC_G00344800 [Dallia pectoralis]
MGDANGPNQRRVLTPFAEDVSGSLPPAPLTRALPLVYVVEICPDITSTASRRLVLDLRGFQADAAGLRTFARFRRSLPAPAEFAGQHENKAADEDSRRGKYRLI